MCLKLLNSRVKPPPGFQPGSPASETDDLPVPL